MCSEKRVFWPQHNFDTVVLKYNAKHHIDDKNITMYCHAGLKWSNILWYLENHDEWKQYKYIWMPDDDLQVSETDISRFFRIVNEKKLPISQPSQYDQYVSHKCLINRGSTIRRTGFVESQMPCFSVDFVKNKLLPFMQKNRDLLGGWGIDIWWSRQSPAFVVDAIKVLHTRPVHKKQIYRDIMKKLLNRNGIKK